MTNVFSFLLALAMLMLACSLALSPGDAVHFVTLSTAATPTA